MGPRLTHSDCGMTCEPSFINRKFLACSQELAEVIWTCVVWGGVVPSKYRVQYMEPTTYNGLSALLDAFGKEAAPATAQGSSGRRTDRKQDWEASELSAGRIASGNDGICLRRRRRRRSGYVLAHKPKIPNHRNGDGRRVGGLSHLSYAGLRGRMSCEEY